MLNARDTALTALLEQWETRARALFDLGVKDKATAIMECRADLDALVAAVPGQAPSLDQEDSERRRDVERYDAARLKNSLDLVGVHNRVVVALIRQLRAAGQEPYVTPLDMNAARVDYESRYDAANDRHLLHVVGDDQGAAPGQAPPSQHFCVNCHHRWEGDRESDRRGLTEYCGDCHRKAQRAMDEQTERKVREGGQAPPSQTPPLSVYWCRKCCLTYPNADWCPNGHGADTNAEVYGDRSMLGAHVEKTEGGGQAPPSPPPANQGSVLQDWVMTMPWKCQSILLSGLRGTDYDQPPAIKAVSRWLRTISQHNADPTKGYMQPDALPTPLEFCAELEYQTCHYVHHVADALRTVAIWHPTLDIQQRAFDYHFRIAEELFHFAPEGDGVFIERHKTVAPSRGVQGPAASPSTGEQWKHTPTCPAYGNYQPPYEDCTCGAEPKESK